MPLRSAQYAAQHLGILFAQVFVQHLAQMAHQLLLLTGLHDAGDLGDEVSRLLTHFGRLVVHAPQDGAANLR